VKEPTPNRQDKAVNQMRNHLERQRLTTTRVSIGIALTLGLGIGGFLGSAELAGSTSLPRSAPTKSPRTVVLRLRDVAVLGRIRCVAISDSRDEPMVGAYIRCSRRPFRSTRYGVDYSPNHASVWEKGTEMPLYTTP